MRRTEQVQGLRLMKFGGGSTGAPASIGLRSGGGGGGSGCLCGAQWGRRWRDRYEARWDGPTLVSTTAAWAAFRRGVRAGGRTCARVLELFDTRYWDFTAALPREAGGFDHCFLRGWTVCALAAMLASPMTAQARGAQAWGDRRQAAAPRPARHGVRARARASPRVGLRSMVGPDRHHGRCDQRYLLGLHRRRQRAWMSSSRAPGGRPRPSGPRACSARSTPTSRQPLLEHARGRRKVDWTPRPRSASALAQLGIEVDRGRLLLAQRQGALGAHVRRPCEALCTKPG